MDIGIIGGADGPTAIFVASNIIPYVIVAVIAVGCAVTVAIVRAINKRKSKH